MKSENGITLTSLVIYVVVATIVIGTMAMVSSLFFSNINLIKDQDKYAPEFNKFNMFFIEDCKNNQTAEVDEQNKKVTFEDQTIYVYNSEEKAIYRNDKKIAEDVQSIEISTNKWNVENTTTSKQSITVKMTIGTDKILSQEIEYILRYWKYNVN